MPDPRLLAGALAGLALTGAADAAAQDSDAGLLRDHAPLLRYDSAERHHAQPISRETEELPADVAYGHVAREDGQRWLQYWLFYPYNEQDRGILRTGRHEGDWEFVQVRLDESGRPDAATFAQHSWAEACAAEDLELTPDGGSVIAYVANGSHASLPGAGTSDRPWPDPDDEADGGGREVRPKVVPVEGETPWIRDPAPWGGSDAGIVPGEQSSPVGPYFAEGDRWRAPASFHVNARACGSGPPGRPWVLPGLAGVGLVVIAVLWTVARRRA